VQIVLVRNETNLLESTFTAWISGQAQTVVVKRRTKTGRVAYRLRVKPINRGRYDFLAGRAMTFATGTIRPDLVKLWERALQRAASGGGDE
jgi:hypothetical protein